MGFSGLAALSLGAKLDLCENFGLSSAAITALLQELDAVSLARLQTLTGIGTPTVFSLVVVCLWVLMSGLRTKLPLVLFSLLPL